MKPIEPGCLAVLIQGYFVGRVVRVVSFVGKPPYHPPEFFRPSDYWLCDAEWIPAEIYPYARDPWLMRIDGGEELEEHETEASDTKWQSVITL